MDEANGTNHYDERTKLLAMQVARNRTNVAQWGLNIAIFLFGLLIITAVLVYLGINPIIVAMIAILGLIVVWYVGRKRGKQLYQRFLTEEMVSLQQEPSKKTMELVSQLTYREIQTLHFAAQGYANKRIAYELGISVSTVKHFVSSALIKLNASDRTEAVVIAMKNKVIPID
jgi:DNA-binding CsgD family transcriptional regulator